MILIELSTWKENRDFDNLVGGAKWSENVPSYGVCDQI